MYRRVRRYQRILHARHRVLWQPPSFFSQWAPSRLTVEGISYSCGEQFFAAEKSGLFGDHQTLQHIMRVSDPRLHKQYGREVRGFVLAVWERERENVVLVGSYDKFARNPVMQYISWTRATGSSRKLALTTSYGASDTGLTTSLHASRSYGVA